MREEEASSQFNHRGRLLCLLLNCLFITCVQFALYNDGLHSGGPHLSIAYSGIHVHVGDNDGSSKARRILTPTILKIYEDVYV